MSEPVITADSRPKLRSDLVIRCVPEGASETWVVKDPVSDRFFRFKSIEGFILGQLDGATQLEAIRQKVVAEFSANLSVETLASFVKRLENIGLFGDPKAPATSRPPLRGSVLYLRLKAFDPDRALERMHARLGFLFTRGFVWISALTIVGAFGITFANWTEIEMALPQLYSVHSLALAWVIAVAVIIAHEHAHGLTCKHFGGSVREMGLLLIFFQPAFYCNVSDAWLFPKKSSRLWVTFAGAYFEMFLWALATIVWRVTEPNTLINYVTFVIVVTSAVKSLFNLNPLIKLDGYYLLSDALEIPNLRQRAFAWIGAWASRLTGGDAAIPKTTARERKIFLMYGVLAWVYSLWLLAWVFVNFGGYLTSHYQGWGFVALSTLVLLLFQYRIRKLLQGFRRAGTVGGRMRTFLKWSIRLVILGAIAAALYFIRMDLKVGGAFTVLPLRNADIRAEVEGVIQEIHVGEGDRVKAGAPIANLFDRDLKAELRKSKAELEETQARLDLLKAGTRAEEINLLRTSIAKADQRVKYAKVQLDMQQTLAIDKLVSQKELEEAKEQVAVREKELQEAEDKLKLALAGSRKEEISAVDAEVSRLKAQQRYIEDQLELLTIRSPIDGVVITHRLQEKTGRTAKRGDLVAEVQEMNTVTAEIAIPEKEIGDVKTGAKVLLKLRAYPGMSFTGTVDHIAPVATAPDDARADRTVLVVTHLDNKDRLLKPEMTGHAKISCGVHRLSDIVTRRVIRFVRVEFWSWW